MRWPLRSTFDYATRSDHQSTLAFVRTVGGEPQYAFYDEADRVAKLDLSPRLDSRSTTSTRSMSDRRRWSTTTGAAQTLAMVKDARGSATISFDPNCRPNLVRDKARYVERMNAFAAAADIVRMSDVDFEYLHGDHDYAGSGEVDDRSGRGPGGGHARQSRVPRPGTARRAL